MTSTVINTLTGSETWPASTSSFYVFAVKSPSSAWEERGLRDAATQENSAVRKLGPCSIHMTAPDRSADKGRWFQQSYTVEDGTILKLTASQSGRIWGERRKALHQFVQVHTRAPLMNISLALQGAVESPGRLSLPSAYLYGRLRVLTVEQAIALGVRVSPRARHLFEDAIGDTLRFTEVEAAPEPTQEERAQERAPAVVVNDVHGTPVQITVRRRGRAVR